jgi:hypothetical protein
MFQRKLSLPSSGYKNLRARESVSSWQADTCSLHHVRSDNVGKPCLSGNHRLTSSTRDSCRHFRIMWGIKQWKVCSLQLQNEICRSVNLTSFQMPVVERLSSNHASDFQSDVISGTYTGLHIFLTAVRVKMEMNSCTSAPIISCLGVQ